MIWIFHLRCIVLALHLQRNIWQVACKAVCDPHVYDFKLGCAKPGGHRCNCRQRWLGKFLKNSRCDQPCSKLMLVGAGMDKTTISGNRSTAGPDKATACDISFENTAGPQSGKAVALRVESDHSAFYRCRFQGFQDTPYTRRRSQFFRDCEIYGTVDFIFGDSSVVFQNCMIYALKPLAQQKNTIIIQNHYPTATDRSLTRATNQGRTHSEPICHYHR